MHKITNTQAGPRGVNAKGGIVMIEPGQTLDVDIDAGELDNSRKTGWFTFDGEKPEAKHATSSTGALTAEHRGGGRYYVMDGDTVLGEPMSKEDAEAFNALSDADKAALAKKV